MKYYNYLWEGITLKNLLSNDKLCKNCPYHLGQVQFVENPCPECKINNFSVYYQLTKENKFPKKEGSHEL